MFSIAKCSTFRLFISEEQVTLLHLRILRVTRFYAVSIIGTVCIDSVFRKVLSAEGTDKLVSLEFRSIAIDKASPLVHLMSSLLIEFFLVEIVLFL